jgi:hypothetical protein
MVSVLLNGEMYEVEPAVKAYIEQLEEKNNYFLEKIQSFYKNEKLDLIERGRFLRELNDKIDENAKCRMAVTADELLEFIEEFEPVTEGELVARFSELEEENARLEESFQRATGEIAADPLPRAAVDRKRFNDAANEIGESIEDGNDKMAIAVFVNELEEKLFGGAK